MRIFLSLVALAAVTGALGGTTQPGLPEPNLVTQFVKAFETQNAQGIAALYTEDAKLLPPNEPLVKGRANIERWYAQSFGSGVSAWTLRSRTGMHEGPIAYETGAYSVLLPAGKDNARPRLETCKYVWALRKMSTGWLIDSHMFNSDSTGR